MPLCQVTSSFCFLHSFSFLSIAASRPAQSAQSSEDDLQMRLDALDTTTEAHKSRANPGHQGSGGSRQSATGDFETKKTWERKNHYDYNVWLQWILGHSLFCKICEVFFFIFRAILYSRILCHGSLCIFSARSPCSSHLAKALASLKDQPGTGRVRQGGEGSSGQDPKSVMEKQEMFFQGPMDNPWMIHGHP